MAKKKENKKGWLLAGFLIGTGWLSAEYMRNKYPGGTSGPTVPDDQIFPTGYLVSKHYDINDFTTSNTATQQGITEQFNPPGNIIKRGSIFAFRLLDPLTDCFGERFKINSWYRSPELQTALGQSNTSQHGVGNAVDINPRMDKVNRTSEIINCLLNTGLPFDQLIIEEGTVQNPNHIHISLNTDKTPQEQRMQVLRYNGQDYIPKDLHWLAENY